MLETIKEFFWSLFPPCLVKTYRGVLGLKEGDKKFIEITHPYWTKGYGTSCAVLLTWALKQCNWPGPLNRGENFVRGGHMAPILNYAKENEMVFYDIPISKLKMGDIIYLEGSKPDDWHVGVVEKNQYPEKIVTLDGGQKIGNLEAFNRVERPIIGEKLGPSPRNVKLVIRPKKR